MALFTLGNATNNPLKYEQLDGQETVTSTSSLPTSSAAQMSAGTDRRSFEGTTTQPTATAPLRPMIGSTADTSSVGSGTAAQANSGGFGLQAATQTFGGVGSSLANPNASNVSSDNSIATTPTEGSIANASSTGTAASFLTENTIVNNNITNNPNPPPPLPEVAETTPRQAPQSRSTASPESSRIFMWMPPFPTSTPKSSYPSPIS